MDKLIETAIDAKGEPVEKKAYRGANVSSKQRRSIAASGKSGSRKNSAAADAANHNSFLRGFGDNKAGRLRARQLHRQRTYRSINKAANADPVEAFYEEVEKARSKGLLTLSTKRNTFRANSGTTRAKTRLESALKRGPIRNQRGKNAPRRRTLMNYRAVSALAYLERRSKRNQNTRGLGSDDR